MREKKWEKVSVGEREREKERGRVNSCFSILLFRLSKSITLRPTVLLPHHPEVVLHTLQIKHERR
jgi:hypothetical protein